jgi:hypothetical protein
VRLEDNNKMHVEGLKIGTSLSSCVRPVSAGAEK